MAREFSDLPRAASQPKNYASWQKDFLQGLLATQRLRIFRCPSLKAVAKPGESEAEFKASIALAARESRDAAVEIIAEEIRTQTGRFAGATCTCRGGSKQTKRAGLAGPASDSDFFGFNSLRSASSGARL